MNPINSIGNAGDLLPKERKVARQTSYQPVVIDQAPVEVKADKQPVRPGTESAIKSAADYGQYIEKEQLFTVKTEKQIQTYKSFELNEKKAALGELLGVDIYA